MVQGSVLRTNYRITGNILNTLTLGAGILKSSNAGSVGFTDPNGGFIFFSASGSFTNDDAGTAAGWSCAFGDSTHGTMSLYYGSGNMPDGYVFFPMFFHVLSISDTAYTALTAGSLVPRFFPIAFGVSGSIWMISALKQGTLGTAVFSSTFASEIDAKLLIGGFLVSGP